MTAPEQTRHIKSILTNQAPHAELAEDMRLYARGFPDGLASAFRIYADNLEMCFQHYDYPLRIYAAWMTERARLADPQLTPKKAKDELAPRFLEFVENRSTGLKEFALAHARMAYVSVWSIYESFLQDLVRALGNELPETLGGDESQKVLKQITDHGRLISKLVSEAQPNLGDMLFEQLTPPGYAQLKRLLLSTALFGRKPRVVAPFKASRLRLFEKRRHLIAHNAGRIDAKYVRETDHAGPVGDLVPVSPFDILDGLSAIHEVAFNLAAELTGHFKHKRLSAELEQLREARTQNPSDAGLDSQINDLEKRLQAVNADT